MKKMEEQLVKKLLDEKQAFLEQLISWSFDELYEMKENYFNSFKQTNSVLIWEKLQLVSEAIDIKKGNVEQVWDYLT